MGVNRSVRLSDAIDDFILFRRSMDLAKATLRADESTLRQFMAQTGNIWVHSISTTHVAHFFTEGARTRQPQSQRNDHARLQVFFEWARKTGRMPRDHDPLYGRRVPRAAKKERRRVPVAKFPALLDAAGDRDPRDRVAIALLLYTLGRDSEISDLRIRDVALDSGYIHMRIHKTREEDLMPICAELDQELRHWLTFYSQQVGFLEPGHVLVPSRQTSPIYDNGRIVGATTHSYVPTKQAVQLAKIAKPALTAIGFMDNNTDREGAHTIRRSGARALFDQLAANGYDRALRLVQSMLHHASIGTTEKYIGVTADRRSRDEIIRGQVLFPTGDVVNLRSVASGEEASHSRSV